MQCESAFNESRGFTPGNTAGLPDTTRQAETFNESRGFTPGNTCRLSAPQPSSAEPFNESRGFTPGNTCLLWWP